MAYHIYTFLDEDLRDELITLLKLPPSEITPDQIARREELVIQGQQTYEEYFYGRERYLIDEIRQTLAGVTYETITDYLRSLLTKIDKLPPEYSRDIVKAIGTFFERNISVHMDKHISGYMHDLIQCPQIIAAKHLLAESDPELLTEIQTAADEEIQRRTEEILTERSEILAGLNDALPTKTIALVDNLTRNTFTNKLSEEEKKVYFKAGSTDYYSLASIKPREPTSIDISTILSRYEWEVYNALCTLWEEGIYTFTATKVYRIMNHDETVTPHNTAVRLIDKAIHTISGITMSLNTGTVGDLYKFAKYTRCEPLILVSFYYEYTNNQHGVTVTPTYTIPSNIKPILYEFAGKVGQIRRQPLAAGKSATRNTPGLLMLRSTLDDRINAMKKRQGKMPNVIRYESLYALYDLTKNPKSKQARIRSQATKILDEKIKAGDISGYEIEKNRRGEYVSITIILARS